MKIAFFLPCAMALLAFATGDESVLTETVLNISNVAAQLSALAYENATEYALLDANGNITGYDHPDFDEIYFHTVEPDQAIVAKRDGRCWVAFRGTNANLADWEQNIDLGEVNIYKDNDNTTDEFCVARAGFAEFVLTPEVLPAYEELSTCVDTCSDPEDCVVITGHSQGAASSIILSILIYSLTPTVVTFGMPPALKEGCAFVHSDRFYRFVNFRQEDDEFDDIGFDPVPFSPTFISGSVHYGHYILVGPDKTAAKYLGFDQNYTFEVDFSDRQNEIASHTMNGTDYSYAARVANLLNSTSFPVSTDGFSDGTACETQYREICASGTCRNFSCAQPLNELCVKGSCEDDSDCVSGVCIWDACASADGEVAGGCPCRDNSNCKSGDCDTSVTGLDWVCEYAPGEATSTPGEATSAGDHAFYGKTFSVGAMLGILFSFM